MEGCVAIVLANPEEVKNRRGHKTDRKDAQHLADLLRQDHVRSSYIPPEPVRQLRDLTRRRVQLTQDATRERNRVQKLLEQVSVKIASVLTDVFGVSGLQMLSALLEGQAAPEEIAQLARGTAKRKIPQLIEAMEGNRMSDHIRFVIRSCLRHLACLEEEVEELDAENHTAHASSFLPEGLSHCCNPFPGIIEAACLQESKRLLGDLVRGSTARLTEQRPTSFPWFSTSERIVLRAGVAAFPSRVILSLFVSISVVTSLRIAHALNSKSAARPEQSAA